MLAYVFWHWPHISAPLPAYEEALRAFHRALRDQPPPRVLRSYAWQVEGAPWLSVRNAYEDWYLIDSAATLDTIGVVAVESPFAQYHQAVASLSGGGTAALYRAVTPSDAGPDESTATWFDKPRHISYSQLDAALQEAGLEHSGLWQRMLVLGPSPEFCLIDANGDVRQIGIEAAIVPRTLIWG